MLLLPLQCYCATLASLVMESTVKLHTRPVAGCNPRVCEAFLGLLTVVLLVLRPWHLPRVLRRMEARPHGQQERLRSEGFGSQAGNKRSSNHCRSRCVETKPLTGLLLFLHLSPDRWFRGIMSGPVEVEARCVFAPFFFQPVPAVASKGF